MALNVGYISRVFPILSEYDHSIKIEGDPMLVNYTLSSP